jgi:hypothetical protein
LRCKRNALTHIVFVESNFTSGNIVSNANHPDTLSLLGTVTGGQTVFGPYSSATIVRLESTSGEILYDYGIAPAVLDKQSFQLQPTPVAVNVTGGVSAAAILGGLVTSTTAAAVAGTVPTGTVMDTSMTAFNVNDSVDWTVISTGANAFTVTAATGHTLVGTMVVATATSGRFRTTKTAAATYVTYRLS